MLDGVGFGAARSIEPEFSKLELFPGGQRVGRSEAIVDLAQRTLQTCSLPLLSEQEHNILAEPFIPDALGVSPDHSHRIRSILTGLGPQVSLVGHWNPDYDCVAGIAIARYLLEQAGIKASIFVSGGARGGAAQALCELNRGLEFYPASELPQNIPFVLIDAPDSRLAHVGVPEGRRPTMVIDTHAGGTNAALACISDKHAAVSSVMLTLLFDQISPDDGRFRTPELSRLVTLAFLGIMTDTASLRRATPYDIEAVRTVLPFVDGDLLRNYQQANSERDLTALLWEIQNLAEPSAQHRPDTCYKQENGFLICCLGAQSASRHDLMAAAADAICFRRDAGGPLAVLLVYQDEQAKAVTGILRIDAHHLSYPDFNIQKLVAHIFPGKYAGHRGGNVGGGRITNLDDLQAAQSEVIARYFDFAQDFAERHSVE